MPARINRVIELLEQGQPVYYTGVPEVSYEAGLAAVQTWADYLNVELEHGAFDMGALDAFMRGLVDGGPTRSGHRTPAVIVTLPTDGTDEHVMRANAWMVKQVLARGVHGILLCHAETPAAVKVFVESARYPFHTLGVGQGLDQGRRGSGGQGHAAAIWGVSVAEYLDRADVWPLNPNGELLLGLKIENRRALENAELSTRVPGIAFAEWGPGDMGMSFGWKDAHDPPYPPEMEAARARVKAACDAAGIAFLNGVTPENVVQMIDEGVKICSTRSREAADIGRRYTGRTLPV
ncbi:aldolase/citrate lyase family protein [Litorilinea aerophila]|uniref:HpcH/HpaI aldolase/citrate lyase domain-containing protein n=1 Tax=Litorilinea aerophila TaxID=1204385 RepID=A0A540VA40_9CHLR|nr:aldolase/citrate lyase family protein [Litorilinea aerophila]MCC9078443.1 aldolase/citrate lyase family protein [Litorilinea aerophila]